MDGSVLCGPAHHSSLPVFRGLCGLGGWVGKWQRLGSCPCTGAMQHAGETDEGPKHMLSPVPLHSSILFQIPSLGFGPEKAPAEEWGSFLPPCSDNKRWFCQPWRWQLYHKPLFSQQEKKIPSSVNAQIPYGFAILLGTSSCMFELPCFRITGHFMPTHCGAHCLLWRATHMAGSQSCFLLKGACIRSR